MRARAHAHVLLLAGALAPAVVQAQHEIEQVGLYRLGDGDVLVVRDAAGTWVPVEALGAAAGPARRELRQGVSCARLEDLGGFLDEAAGEIRLPSPAAGGHEAVALVRIVVDGSDVGGTIAVRRDGQWWIPAERLPPLAVARRARLDGVDSAALGSLAPPWAVEVDEARGEVRFTRAAPPVDSGVSLVKLEVDGLPRGETLVVRRREQWIVAADLLRLLALPVPPVEMVDGVPSVSLSALAAPVTAFVDEAAGVLRLATRAGNEGVALYAVTLNEAAHGEALVVRRVGEPFVAVAALEAMGLEGFGGQRSRIEGVDHVALRSLSPALVYQVDERKLQLRLSAQPSLLRGIDQVAILELVVNETPRGEVTARLRGRDVRVPVDALEKAGLAGFAGERSEIEGVAHVALASLAPQVTFRFDEEALALRLTADPALLGTVVRHVAAAAPRDLVHARDSSAFLNYAVGARGGAEPGTEPLLDGSLEAAVSLRGALASSTVSRNGDGRLSRGLSALTVDHRTRLLRFVAGDTFVDAGALGGSAVFGGVSVARVFDLDPYRPSLPTLELNGAASTPSTVEVYVNDRLVRREEIPAGRFALDGIAAESGAGTTRVVLRDAFGREQTVRNPYYLSRGALAPGAHDLAIAAGVLRAQTPALDATWDPGRYEPEPALLARHRVGLARWLTIGSRLEVTTLLASGGPSLTLGSRFLGQLDLAAAVSRDGETRGHAATAAWTWSSRRLGAGASVRRLSEGYANLGTRAAADRVLLDARAFGSVQVGSFGTLAIQHSASDSRDVPDVRRTSVSLAFQPLRRSTLFVSVGRSERVGSDPSLDVFAGFTLALGEATTGSVQHDLSSGRGASLATVQRALPSGTGFGYRVMARQETVGTPPPGSPVAPPPPATGSATLLFQNRSGRFEAGVDGTADRVDPHARAAGAIIVVGGGLHVTRPVQQGFALVRVPGVSGVRVYAANQEIGRTNRRGHVLVPDLLSYYGNRLAIEDADVPLQYALGDTSRTVAPPLRGGAVVTFPVARVSAVTGRVSLPGGKAPAFGEAQITLEGRVLRSPLGRNGEFYFEDLAPGRWAAQVRWRGDTWSFDLVVPEDGGGAPVIDVGAIPLKRAAR